MNNSTGYANTGIGFHSLLSNTTGNKNTGIGDYALSANSGGIENTSLGYNALYLNSVGDNNTAIGKHALESNSIGNNNTAIGSDADVINGGLSYATVIGADAEVGCSNCLVLGGTGSASTFVGINTNNPDADLLVRQKSDVGGNTTRGLKLKRNTGTGTFWRTYVDGLNLLTFEYNDLGDGNWAYINTSGDFVSGSDARIKKDVEPLSGTLEKIKLLAPKSYHYNHQDNSDPIHYGLIAQELETVYPDMVYTRENGTKGIAYTQLISVALDAINEQQTLIDTLQTQNQELLTRLQNLENAVAGLKSK